MTPVCVVVGAPGAGKSAVGAAVAARLGVSFCDTDAAIEEALDKSIADIFFDDGEPAFRRAELIAVIAALADCDGVVAVGGGAVHDPRTRQELAAHRVVWLDVGFADAVQRVGLGAGRPMLDINPRATLARLLEERRPLYAEVADITVSTDGRVVDDVADEVVAALAELGVAR